MFILTSFEKRQFDIRQLNANKLLQHGSQSERLETLKAWVDHQVVLFSNVYAIFTRNLLHSSTLYKFRGHFTFVQSSFFQRYFKLNTKDG